MFECHPQFHPCKISQIPPPLLCPAAAAPAWECKNAASTHVPYTIMAGKHGGQAGPKPKRAGKVLGKRKAKDAPRKAAPAPVPKPPVKGRA